MRKRRQAREEQEKREVRRPFVKKLCAALLRLFRGQHGEKLKVEATVDWCSATAIVRVIGRKNDRPGVSAVR